MKTIGFIGAAKYFGRGWQLVKVPGLRRFVLIPLAINVVVFATMGWLLFGALFDWMSGWAFFERFADVWLIAKLQQILQFIVGTIMTIVLVYAFTLVANIIGAPFNSLLAERVEQYLTGTSPTSDPSLTFLIKSIPSTLLSEASKLLYLLKWTIPLLLVGFIPVINIAAPFLVFGFGAWMFALEYLDYPMGNRDMRFKDVTKTLRQRRTMSLGFGSLVAVASAIPILNLVVMPIAVAGATALYVEHMKSSAA